MDGRIAHADERFVGKEPGAGVAGGLHAETERALAAVHIRDQHAVLYQRHVAGGRALVVDEHGKGAAAAEGGIGEVRQSDLFGGHAFVQTVARYAASEHEVRFHGMPDGLVRQHPGHHPAEDDGLFARVGVHALALLHEIFVKTVYFFIIFRGIGEIEVEGAFSAEGAEKVHRHSRGSLGS